MLSVAKIHHIADPAAPVLDPADANPVLHPLPKPMLQKEDSAKPIPNSRSLRIAPKAFLDLPDPLTSMV